ncbi:MAG: CHAT domain-containing protein, partial [Candidatus Eremiobacterota bacterium]
LEGRLRACQQRVREPSSDLAMSTSLRDLHDQLWGPLEESFPPGTRVVLLSPDGELNFLSWATLLTPEDRFLAEEYDLRYLSSGRDLLEPARPGTGRVAMALGGVDFASMPATAPPGTRGLNSLERDSRGLRFDALPGTDRELDALAAELRGRGWEVELARGPAASEAWVQSAHSPRILHLATHGFFFPTIEVLHRDAARTTQEPVVRLVNPMHRSGLALAGAQRTRDAWQRGETPTSSEDGLLTAAEVGTLDLSDTWLVCLSACEAGRGTARAGEGVLGLRRGFVQAGARNLLITLWRVHDEETARFMLDFYQAALKDGDAPAALARTQREWLVNLRKKPGCGLDGAVKIAGPFVMSSQGPP